MKCGATATMYTLQLSGIAFFSRSYIVECRCCVCVVLAYTRWSLSLSLFFILSIFSRLCGWKCKKVFFCASMRQKKKNKMKIIELCMRKREKCSIWIEFSHFLIQLLILCFEVVLKEQKSGVSKNYEKKI